MRILLVSQEDIICPQGGIGTYVRNLSLSLASFGHDVHLIVRHYPGAPAFESYQEVNVHRVASPGPAVLYGLSFSIQVRLLYSKLSHARRFDVVHSNMPLMSSSAIFGPGTPPVVETVQTTMLDEYRALKSGTRRQNPNERLTRVLFPAILNQERRLLRRARHLIAVSNAIGDDLRRLYGCPSEKITVLPNGINTEDFDRQVRLESARALRAELGLGADDRVILYLGRLMERKRVGDLVRAMPEVLTAVPNARLVVVGRHTQLADQLRTLSIDLGLADRVRFVNHVPYADVPSYYAVADVFALPSSYEGLPFAVLEAMATRTPIAATDIPGITEQIRHGTTGLLHPVGDVAALADNLTRLLRDEALAQRLASEAWTDVNNRFSWRVLGRASEAVLARACGAS